MEYRFSGEVNFNDFMQFHQFIIRNFFKTLFPKKQMIYIIIGFLIVLYGYLQRENTLYHITLFIIVLLPVILIVLIIYFCKGLYKKLYEKDKTNGKYCDYIIDKNKIVVRFNDDFMNIEKEAVLKIQDDKDSIYIFLEDNFAKIIKKRFFNDENQFMNLLNFLREEYKEKNKKK